MPTTLIPRQLVAAFLLAAVFVLPACDTGGTEDPPDDGQIVSGVNFTRLFAEPTDAELQAVKDEWASRRTESSGTPKTVASETYDGAFHGILQHTVTSSGQDNVTHFGVVRIPDGASDLPILVIHHGGDDGLALTATSANTGVEQWVDAFPELAASTVQIWPVYRSETITLTGSPVAGGPFTASGDPSPWDYDVDDSIAFLDAVVERWGDFVDENRVAAMGMSRGANTALLHAIRDDRIDAVVDYYGPTDFYNRAGAQSLAIILLGQQENNPLRDQTLTLPGAQFLYDSVLNPLRNADGSYNAAADYTSAKREVLRRSASAFTGDLPDTQVHHHVADPVVPFAFSQALRETAEASGAPAVFEFYSYGTETDAPNGAFHAPELSPAMQPSLARTEAFLQEALGIGVATRLALEY